MTSVDVDLRVDGQSFHAEEIDTQGSHNGRLVGQKLAIAAWDYAKRQNGSIGTIIQLMAIKDGFNTQIDAVMR